MRVGLLTLHFRLYAVDSIKTKRSIVKRMVADVQRGGPSFAVCEAGSQDDLSRLTLRVAHLSNDARYTDSSLSRLRDKLDRGDHFEVAESEIEIL